jgi:MFS transporter, FHS family, Na+ dependent glucose transporter 1
MDPTNVNTLQPAHALQAQRMRIRLASTAAYYAAYIGMGLTTASLGPLLPLLADQTQVRLGLVSILFTARWLGYLIGSLSSGRLFDRRAGHPIIAAGLALMAICMLMTPVIPQLFGLALVMLLLGGAEASLDVGGNTLIIWLHGKQVAPFMNGLHFFFGVGALISPLIIAQVLLVSGQYPWSVRLIALFITPIALVLLRLPSPVSPDQETKVAKDATINRDALAQKINWKIVLLFVLFFTAAVGAEQSFGGWIFAFSLGIGLTTAQTAAYLTSAYWGAFTLSRLGSIYLGSRLSTRVYLVISLASCTLSLSLLNTLRFLGTGNAAMAVLWLGTVFFGVSIAAIFPVTMSYASERMGISGQVASLFFVGVGLGGMFVPWLIGQFFETAGAYSTMVIILLTILCGSVAFALIDRITSAITT